ncbi:Uncharacterised protein [Vibrio cholerae]|uniref:Uncharacterized protein n=1 Tax=Vibrio cholerae TaxID=666 RepID=A0A655QHX1_VIBCL|nr:Uncharacterised protein [Vibrio cholerae]CSC06391.1 Uncharacterised protein [Vibrio cholerae]CSI22315.1 Uncharacterised protein [Vibrio cholerae]
MVTQVEMLSNVFVLFATHPDRDTFRFIKQLHRHIIHISMI